MSAIRIWMLILLSLVFIPACLPLFKHSGTEKNTMQTARIEPGKTLKKDALEWFGPPMIIAGLGEVVTLPDPTRLDKTYKGPRNLNTVEAAALFELFAAKHEFNDYHRVYYFHHAKSKLTTYFFLVVALYIDADTDFDKLWLLVNEQTGIVEDYYFRPMGEADPRSTPSAPQKKLSALQQGESLENTFLSKQDQ